MAYMFLSLSFIFLIAATVLYITRAHWLQRLPELPYLQGYNSVPTSFRDDVEAGLHSSAFDLSSNIVEGDSRSGLDESGKREVQKIMKKNKVGFDEARRLYMQKQFGKHGIGSDGLPRDPKFVSFS